MNRNFLKSQISDAVSIPKDVLFGVPIMRLIGSEEFYIENYRGILEYTENVIRIQTKIGQIVLKGKKLEIISYTNDEMKVIGDIELLECPSGRTVC